MIISLLVAGGPEELYWECEKGSSHLDGQQGKGSLQEDPQHSTQWCLERYLSDKGTSFLRLSFPQGWELNASLFKWWSHQSSKDDKMGNDILVYKKSSRTYTQKKGPLVAKEMVTTCAFLKAQIYTGSKILDTGHQTRHLPNPVLNLLPHFGHQLIRGTKASGCTTL